MRSARGRHAIQAHLPNLLAAASESASAVHCGSPCPGVAPRTQPSGYEAGLRNLPQPQCLQAITCKELGLRCLHQSMPIVQFHQPLHARLHASFARSQWDS